MATVIAAVGWVIFLGGFGSVNSWVKCTLCVIQHIRNNVSVLACVCVHMCVYVCLCVCVCVWNCHTISWTNYIHTFVQAKPQQCIGEHAVLLHGRSLSSTGNTADRSSNSSVGGTVIQDYTGNSHAIRILTHLNMVLITGVFFLYACLRAHGSMF